MLCFGVSTLQGMGKYLFVAPWRKSSQNIWCSLLDLDIIKDKFGVMRHVAEAGLSQGGMSAGGIPT